MVVDSFVIQTMAKELCLKEQMFANETYKTSPLVKGGLEIVL